MIRIDELTLRVPGLTEDEGRQLGNTVADRLSAQWPATITSQHLDDLTIQLTVPSGASSSDLADAIVAQILDQIRLTTL